MPYCDYIQPGKYVIRILDKDGVVIKRAESNLTLCQRIVVRLSRNYDNSRQANYVAWNVFHPTSRNAFARGP
jgi:hypothetical protein